MFTVELEGAEELEHEWNEGVREFGAGVRRAVVLASKEGATEGVRTATWKDRTGAARRTITSKVVKDSFGQVEADIVAPLHYHPHLDAGTKPHEILPIRARFLRFIAKDGNLVFTRRVWHPGTKGDGFAGRMYFKAERVLQAEVERAVARLAERFG
jgi:hypothetical protein